MDGLENLIVEISVLAIACYIISCLAQVISRYTSMPRTFPLFFGLVMMLAYGQIVGRPEEQVVNIGIEALLGPTLLYLGVMLSIRVIIKEWKAILLGGAVYISVTLVFIMLAYYLYTKNMTSAFFIGAILTMSSTLLAHARLEEIAKDNTPEGRFCTGLLISQDLALLPFTIVSLLLHNSHNGIPIQTNIRIASYVLVGIIVLLIILAIEMVFAKTIFKKTEGEKPEDHNLYHTVVGTIILITSFISVHYAGLSFPMGMFISGLVINQTEKRERIAHFAHTWTFYALPLLIGCLAARLDLALLMKHWLMVLTSVIFVLLIKGCIGLLVGWYFGYSKRTSFRMGALLGPMGASATALANEAFQHQHLTTVEFQVLNAIIVFSMLLFPFSIKLARWASENMSTETRHVDTVA